LANQNAPRPGNWESAMWYPAQDIRLRFIRHLVADPWPLVIDNLQSDSGIQRVLFYSKNVSFFREKKVNNYRWMHR